jgi:hypothetical protein
MALDFLFALRGLLAFIAFTEITTAARCVLPLPLPDETDGSYVQTKLFSLTPLDASSDRIIGHLFGLATALNALVLVHLAVFSHYRPLASLAFTSVAAKISFVAAHTLWFKTIAADHRLIFPVISCFVTLAAIVCVPFAAGEDPYRIRPWDGYGQDENDELTGSRAGMAAQTKAWRKKKKQE